MCNFGSDEAKALLIKLSDKSSGVKVQYFPVL